MITPLRHWSLNRVIPTIDDSEALSVLELVGKNTSKINELVTDYNNFVDKVNETIDEFENSLNKDYKCFKSKITKICHNYIKVMDMHAAKQDRIINETIVYIKNNIVEAAQNIIEEKLSSGEIKVSEIYDPITESLNIVISEVNS